MIESMEITGHIVWLLECETHIAAFSDRLDLLFQFNSLDGGFHDGCGGINTDGLPLYL